MESVKRQYRGPMSICMLIAFRQGFDPALFPNFGW
jgi:hypothetical protein